MIVTIVVVAYLVVPNVTRFLHAAGGYDPTGYEPKDTARASWLDAKGRMVGLPQFTIDQVVNASSRPCWRGALWLRAPMVCSLKRIPSRTKP